MSRVKEYRFKTVGKVLAYLVLIIAGCKQDKIDPVSYQAELEQWRAERLNKLKSRKGWLNLAGFYWLQPGMNTFGSDTSNTLVFPAKAPAFMGAMELRGDTVYLRSTAEPVWIDSIPATGMKLNDDVTGKPTIMTLHPYAWNVIKRGKRYGIRLRDYESVLLDSLISIPYFETDKRYRIVASFKSYAKPEKSKVQTIIGTEEENLIPGELHFRIFGKKQVLYPFSENGDLFLVFGDLSNGEETYPAGRFLYASAPDDHGQVILDFNKAYNPPCAFTPFATCPLPIRKNILSVRIPAGEKVVHLSSVH